MIKIAVPKDEIYKDLTQNAAEICKENGIMLIEDKEERVGELFVRNSVDLALVSPYDLIRFHRKGDFRIVPGAALGIGGRTGHFNIHIKKEGYGVNNCLLMFNSPLLKKIVEILYAERYNIEINVDMGLPKDKEITDYDIIIDDQCGGDCPIDLTEDWLDTFKQIIPLAVWVGRNEELPLNVIEITNKFAGVSLSEREDLPITDEEMTLHQGFICRQWSEDMNAAIEHLSDVLFYRGEVAEIADIKIMETGDEEEPEPNNNENLNK
jgi:hypothetical protein